MKEKTDMTMKTDAENVVRRAYHLAKGNVMDVQGFIDLLAADGVLNAGQESYGGEQKTRISLPASVIFVSDANTHAVQACDLAGKELGEFETVRRRICSDVQKDAERPPIHRA